MTATLSNAQEIEKYYDYNWKECELNAARYYCLITKTDSGFYRKGFYIREKKEGVWTDYHNNGMMLETYQNGKLTFKQYFDEEGNARKKATHKDISASFPGGKQAWENYLSKALRYPSQYGIVNDDKATAVVNFLA